jgi:N-acyl-D-amino-acid deacylase
MKQFAHLMHLGVVLTGWIATPPELGAQPQPASTEKPAIGTPKVVQADHSPNPAIIAAIEKGLKRIETGVGNYPKHRQCFSCHHQAMAVLSMTAAQRRGFPVDAELLKEQVAFSLRTFRNRTLIARGQGVGGDSTGVVYALHTFAAAEYPYDDTMAALVQYLLVRQRRDGAWPIPAFGDRPPTMGSLFTNTGLALSALKQHRPPQDAQGAAELQQRIDAACNKGRDWLLANQPATTEDRVFHLRGLVAAEVEPQHIEAARRQLLQEQRPDGSWAQLADMVGDAYATATVLVALRQAGLDTSQEAYQKGVTYLLESQQSDGAWIVQTRSRPLQRFFDNGDPGGKSQFISFAATNWAVLALLETIPPSRP